MEQVEFRYELVAPTSDYGTALEDLPFNHWRIADSEPISSSIVDCIKVGISKELATVMRGNPLQMVKLQRIPKTSNSWKVIQKIGLVDTHLIVAHYPIADILKKIKFLK